jgi:hypothetical protein
MPPAKGPIFFSGGRAPVVLVVAITELAGRPVPKAATILRVNGAYSPAVAAAPCDLRPLPLRNVRGSKPVWAVGLAKRSAVRRRPISSS